jgi:lipoyl(octanoyl) transferase
MTDSKGVKLDIVDLGTKPYAAVLQMQLDLCAKRQDDAIDNTVLIVEHPAVITLGARKSENKLLSSEETIRNQGIDLLRVGRGGGTTAHNPGQLVFYPIIKLKSLKLDVNAYIRSLEQVGIELLQSLGVECGRRKGLPGLWIGETKIASIGVQLKKWVSFHGMAINLNNDLGIFDHIVPCGLKDVVITSVQKETGKTADMGAVKEILTKLILTQWSQTTQGTQ